MEELTLALNARKAQLLDRVQLQVNDYVVSTGKNCIAVVERDANGTVVTTWNFSDDLDDFFKRLYLFMRRKKAPSGRPLDSALTDPIIEIVKTEYQQFYQDESEAISAGILQRLSADEIKLGSFVDRISDIALKKVSRTARDKVVKLVTRQIRESVSQGALHNVGHQIGQLATTAAGAQIASVVTHLLLKLLVANMGAIVAKILASAALQHALLLIAKKFVIAAVTGAVVNFLALHLGAAVAGASFMWVIIPIIAGYVAYKIATFPEKLGKTVAKSVRENLESGFEEMNKTVLEKVFGAVFEGGDLITMVAKDRELQVALKTLAEELE